jgi:hypothetical protein
MGVEAPWQNVLDKGFKIYCRFGRQILLNGWNWSIQRDRWCLLHPCALCLQAIDRRWGFYWKRLLDGGTLNKEIL